MEILVAIAVLALGLLAIAFAYLRLFRPWRLSWGATDTELARELPGDDLAPSPSFNATRALTIRASSAQIWPWLVQVGVTRAGRYSYDRLDNFGRESARRIVPELQKLEPGDVLGMSPDGKKGILVHALDEPRSMIWGSPPDSSWSWLLNAQPGGTTRVITRVRNRYRWLSPSIAFSLLIEFADIWMMRRMLLNLRQRIEAVADAAAAGDTAMAPN